MNIFRACDHRRCRRVRALRGGQRSFSLILHGEVRQHPTILEDPPSLPPSLPARSRRSRGRAQGHHAAEAPSATDVRRVLLASAEDKRSPKANPGPRRGHHDRCAAFATRSTRPFPLPEELRSEHAPGHAFPSPASSRALMLDNYGACSAALATSRSTRLDGTGCDTRLRTLQRVRV